VRRFNLLARLLVAVAALALFAAGCGSDDDDDATSDDAVDTTEEGTTGDEPVDEDDLPLVRFQAVAGSLGGLPLMVMEEEGLDVKNGFKGEFSYLDPGGASENFLVGNADVNMGDDVSTTAVFRQEGFDVTAWYPVTNLHVSIVVSEDSEYETPEDLIGEQVGHFGLESGATTYISTAVEEIYGFDPREDYTLVESGPPALPDLLAAGEVDAIFNFEGHVSRAVLEAPGRVLFQTHQAYSEHTGGYAPTLTNLLSTVDWLEENPELAYSVRDAIDEAIGLIEDSDYELISEETYTEQLGLEDPAHVELLIERAADIPVFTTDWSEEFIEQTRDFLDLLVEDGLLTGPPDEMVMTTLEALVGERP
jgi:NitT/TauT family transport system substrate-binding protein